MHVAQQFKLMLVFLNYSHLKLSDCLLIQIELHSPDHKIELHYFSQSQRDMPCNAYLITFHILHLPSSIIYSVAF